MPFSDQYRRQVTLLIRVVPLVAQEDCFALKGGTAINLFVRDLPRLSVDIDSACAALRGIATDMRTGQIQIVPEQMDQQLARFH